MTHVGGRFAAPAVRARPRHEGGFESHSIRSGVRAHIFDIQSVLLVKTIGV